MSPADAAGSDSQVLLGRYRIEKTLGRGGMGEVLLAHDELLHRPVALKRVIPQGEGREEIRRAVLREARRASRITDRHVMQIYDVVELPDEVVLVMEYVDGVTLRERMKDPVTLADFWRLAPQCIAGMAAAHTGGVIHRDIKPENFIVTPAGEVKVLDFGIAKRAVAAEGMTTTASTDSSHHSGEVAGTPAYMAPEVFLGGHVDERADIFSLGVVFYELLTSQRPFEGTTLAAVANQVLNASPPPVQEINPQVSPALSSLVTAMLAKKPAERIDSARSLGKMLTAAHDDPGNAALLAAGERGARSALTLPGATRPMRVPREFLRTPAGIAMLAAAVVLIGVTLWRAVTLPRLPGDINVAVLPPQTPGASDDFASFALGAMEHVNARLRRHTFEPDFQMASFSEGVSEKVRSATDAHRVLGTNVALVTTMEQSPDQLRARIELRDAGRDRLIAFRRIAVPIEQPFLYLDRLYRESATLLKRSPEADSARARLGMRGTGTLHFYLQGMGRARSAEDEAQLARAAEDLRSACRAEPEAGVAWAGLALVQVKLRQRTGDGAWLARADSVSSIALDRDATRMEPHRIRAFIFSMEKRFPEAVLEYRRAAEIDSSDLDLVPLRGRAMAGAGDREGEGAIYRAEAARRPQAWQPWWWLASWNQRAGRVDEVIPCYREMVRRAPDFHQGYSDLGGYLVLQGRYVQAIDTLKISLRLMPTQSAFDNLGSAYFNLGRFPEAVDAYNQSLQFGKADYRAWLNLGDAYYLQAGRKAEARDAYAQAVRLGRERAEERSRRSASTVDLALISNMATLFARLGLADSARVYLNRALAADSTDADVRYRAALTFWALDEREAALSALEKSVRAGYPTSWIRDSPMFHEWRDLDRFRQLVGDTLRDHASVAARSAGG